MDFIIQTAALELHGIAESFQEQCARERVQAAIDGVDPKDPAVPTLWPTTMSARSPREGDDGAQSHLRLLGRDPARTRLSAGAAQ